MYIGVRLRARGLSGASLTVRKWQLRCLSSWLTREPKLLGGADGGAEEMFRRDRARRQRRPGSYRDPHPSISDTSMWDKSIMCLCSNCKGFTDAVGVTTRFHPEVIKSNDYLWKLIWKFAACSGLENLATAFLCWGNMENICGGENNGLGVNAPAEGAIGPH